MRSKVDEISQRILVLLKLDAKRLFERVRDREAEYLSIFSSRRTREHFPAIFKNRYDETTINDLKNCSTDVIVALDAFYTVIDEMRWFLTHTEDMPMQVDDRIRHFIHELTVSHETLSLYIDAELGIVSENNFSDEMSAEELSLADEYKVEDLATDFGEISDEVLKDLSES